MTMESRAVKKSLIKRRKPVESIKRVKKRCHLASTESLLNDKSDSESIVNYREPRIMKSYSLNDLNSFNTGKTTIITLTPLNNHVHRQNHINVTKNMNVTNNNIVNNNNNNNNTTNNNNNITNNNQVTPKSSLRFIDHVISELIETEASYVKDLREIIEGYVKPLRLQAMKEMEKKASSATADVVLDRPADPVVATSNNENNSNKCVQTNLKLRSRKPLPSSKVSHVKPGSLTLDETSELFGNIEDIYVFSANFLCQLRSCNSDPDLISRCFIQQSFDVYTNYCAKQYPKMVTMLTDLSKRPEICSLLRERQSALNHFLPLGSYLLKPVQRILKYPLLLQSIVKHVSKNNEDDLKLDAQEVTKALEVMTNYAVHINEVKRKHEMYLSSVSEMKKKKEEVNPFKFIKKFMKKANVFIRICSKKICPK